MVDVISVLTVALSLVVVVVALFVNVTSAPVVSSLAVVVFGTFSVV